MPWGFPPSIRRPQDSNDPKVARLAAEMAGSLHPDRQPLGSIWSSASSPPSPKKQIRRGVHRSTEELERAIRSYIDGHDDPKPFRWTQSADNILAAIKRFCLKSL
jgi:hypothetical protein